jgi:hypothetical protein
MGRRPQKADSFAVLRRGVTLVDGKAISGKKSVETGHQPITHHLGDDGGRTDGGLQTIPADDSAPRRGQAGRHIASIHQNKVRRDREPQHRAAHGSKRRPANIEAINLGRRGKGKRDRMRLLQDQAKEVLARGGGEFFGIIDTAGKPRGIENDGGGRHRPCERAAPSFIDSGNQHGKLTVTGLTMFSCGRRDRATSFIHNGAGPMGDKDMEADTASTDTGSSVENALIRMKSSLTDSPKREATMRAKMPTIEHEEPRNPMFAKLVEREDDTVGLLAYALYKQSKRDWLIAFHELHARTPTDAESRAFITGEQLPRRMQTYRQLAQQQLGLLPAMSTPAPAPVPAPAREASLGVAAAPTPPKAGFFPLNKATLRYLAIMTGLVIGMAIVFRIVAGWLFR